MIIGQTFHVPDKGNVNEKNPVFEVICIADFGSWKVRRLEWDVDPISTLQYKKQTPKQNVKQQKQKQQKQKQKQKQQEPNLTHDLNTWSSFRMT